MQKSHKRLKNLMYTKSSSNHSFPHCVLYDYGFAIPEETFPQKSLVCFLLLFRLFSFLIESLSLYFTPLDIIPYSLVKVKRCKMFFGLSD